MKLYKFRALTSCTDLERIKEIIKTEKFWFSKLWNLNDAMEGVYSTIDYAENLFQMKDELIICSLSKPKALREPLMWGTYAGGYKGLVIEVDLKLDESFKKKSISYKSLDKLNKPIIEDDLNKKVMKIITRKLNSWRREHEVRILRRKLYDEYDNEEKSYSIGKITAIYFGEPYKNLENGSQLANNSKNYKKYVELKETL